MMEDGKISPKKLSVTIISLKSPESSHLLRTIKDFTDGVVDVDEDEFDGKGDDGEGEKDENDNEEDKE